MKTEETKIKGAFIITPTIFGDDRGHFFEPYNKEKLKSVLGNREFTQDNQSLSSKGVLRGLHFQNNPHAQGKLVRVIKGAVNDVIVDIRKDSPSYGKVVKVKLTEENFKMLWVPEGCAHGFETLEDNTIFSYKVTNHYNKESEGCIAWNDPTLNIPWETKNPIISDKDKLGEDFSSFISLF